MLTHAKTLYIGLSFAVHHPMVNNKTAVLLPAFWLCSIIPTPCYVDLMQIALSKYILYPNDAIKINSFQPNSALCWDSNTRGVSKKKKKCFGNIGNFLLQLSH